VEVVSRKLMTVLRALHAMKRSLYFISRGNKSSLKSVSK
jgi:hypothetical protein